MKTAHYLARAAQSWLRSVRQGRYCVISGDKNYGPVVVDVSFMRDAYSQPISACAYDACSKQEFFSRLGSSIELLEVVVDNGRLRGIFFTKTAQCLLHDSRPLAEAKSTDQEHLALRTLGTFRFLAKIHKRMHPCPLREVEVDVRSPFRNVAIWCASILNMLASKCASVLRGSGHLLAHLDEKRWSPSSFLVSADLVDYFQRFNVQKRQVCIEHFAQ